MRTLVILPGLDGTATMHPSFVAASREFFDVVAVISYPPDEVLDYRRLESHVRRLLPREPFVLLAESFSGPIVLAIAKDSPQGLKGVVLSTSFARSPLPFASLLTWLVRFVPLRAVPQSLLSWFLLGRWANAELESNLRAALVRVDAAVLRARAISALRADVPDLAQIRLPVLYLRAAHDRLMPRRNSEELARVIRALEVVEIAGPHLLLQGASLECAQAVGRWANSLK